MNNNFISIILRLPYSILISIYSNHLFIYLSIYLSIYLFYPTHLDIQDRKD